MRRSAKLSRAVAGGDHFVRVAGGFGEMGRYAASIAWYCRLHVLSGMLDLSVG
ncbi:hypothetical protein D3800_09810 [Microcystis aeruginosa NIES-298]|uniref:hypothetical protein n=1 Tax=Microcystis aeruginosa TaxID=1126 RepID=UPI00138D3959|nr:hypothetical protein [Microcystis aeruginosa]QHU83593.1 hypothetical protein D3800_09810 [Microcystis aeruginosa NIES-298]